jgi:cation diffusion facilitator family transporter
MPHRLKRAVDSALFVNIFLFIIKAVVGLISNSIAVISEALNSLTDIISSLAIKRAVDISNQKPDVNHQFGHSAAQPIAAFIVSVFAFVVGINIVEESIKRIIEPQNVNAITAVYIVLISTIVIKVILNRYQRFIARVFKSPAIKAAAVDSLNDVLASSIALLGVLGTGLGLKVVDGIAGILVAAFIFKTGFEVGRQNIDYLMGHSADQNLDRRIREITLAIKGVRGVNDLRSHYVGNKFHIEIHIEVDKNFSTQISHDIGNDVRFTLEQLDDVQKVFVHVDPV